MYQRRFVQLGILRAIGLSARQVAATQASEHLLTTGSGILGGAGLGLLCSHLFIPFMQIGYTQTDLIPPFAVIIA
jgi:putative ABC transport system permease protein